MGKCQTILCVLFFYLPLHSQIPAGSKEQQNASNKSTKLQQLISSAKNQFNQGQYELSISFLTEALKVIDETNERATEPVIYNSLGASYSELGNLSKSLESYYKALQVAEKLGDKDELANAYQYVGAIYEDLKDDSLALKNFSEALKINLERGNRFRYAQNNNSIAYIYALKGKQTDALKIYKESLKIYTEPGAPLWGIPWCHSCIAETYEWLGDSALAAGDKTGGIINYEEALRNHLVSFAKYKEADMLPGYAQQHYYIGVLSFKLNRLREAKKNLATALQLYLQSGSKEMLAETYFYLSRIDSVEGDYENAFRHFKLSTQYHDSVFNSEQSRKVAIYKTQHEIEKKEEEIKLLGTENKLKTTVAEKQKQQKIFAYGAILFLFLLGTYAFYRYRIRKKVEVEQAKLKDRLSISQELHDEIGSTLSSISVYSQVAEKLNEKNNKEELREMLEKIKATSSETISEMNDIVWTINPKNDNMEKIILRMESFARPLLKARNIEFKLEYDPAILIANLEMEKRKNFYLVFKEAVNNAFKYSGCSQIVTFILSLKDGIEMRVTDNGVGFNVQHETSGNKLTLSGNGLGNMRMRAKEMEGNLQINSIAGKGTEVKLTIPIP